MVQVSGWLGRSYSSMLWGSRGWKDIYKVQEFSLEIKDDADEQ